MQFPLATTRQRRPFVSGENAAHLAISFSNRLTIAGR
jgi:hypothetical protein